MKAKSIKSIAVLTGGGDCPGLNAVIRAVTKTAINKFGLERFAVRRYQSMQGLIFLASLAMGFLSFLQSRCKDIRQRIEDKLRYCREPKSFWFYRLVIALRDSLSNRAKMSLSGWCRPP